MKHDDEFAYFKINKLLWRWKKQDGARAVHEVSLSTDSAPPPLPPAPVAAAKSAPSPLKLPKPDPTVKMIDDLLKVAHSVSRFREWLDTPAPPKLTKPAKSPAPKKTVPPFDIQEIPNALRKEMMPIGAKLMERWFAGRLNYSPSPSDEFNEINQHGKPYPPDMYDTTTVKMDWVLKFPRARHKYDYLVNDAIRSPAALRVLHKKLHFYKHRSELSTRDISRDDPQRLHRFFQFQHVEVDGTFAEKIKLQLMADVARTGVPDDLTAALGSFVIYAAVGHVRLSRDPLDTQRTTAEVTGVWTYVKDNFTFTDEPTERSQYLGHWSGNGVIVMPLDGVGAASPYIPYVESPVTLGDPVIKGQVYYPIHNSDFRRWAAKHQRGGDFIIYSDRRFVPLFPPIVLYL
ncbi:DUF6402 family protein [Paraburkholderia sp. MMS20-SJTN17]|uniref:DUF6402 family protein n=1 Tax=Paraburkholderia translucens TaxID=2886945 RepID=A0ABS8K6B1_9BURK|nr:DUF6402 family protein [Paraburkholderia sp. MMS20-SJTN17]MCC8400293.1 DUF6402 family protein [Paraburkholderia sp. MMS20-SJTN17]